MSKSTVFKTLKTLLFIIPISLCVLVYYPGLNGGFYLDDAVNIEDNQHLQIETLSANNLWAAMWSEQSGHIKRA
ncbi:MAG: hypothetical protein AAF304_09660, partial [Pseudomonadota bacterium]